LINNPPPQTLLKNCWFARPRSAEIIFPFAIAPAAERKSFGISKNDAKSFAVPDGIIPSGEFFSQRFIALIAMLTVPSPPATTSVSSLDKSQIAAFIAASSTTRMICVKNPAPKKISAHESVASLKRLSPEYGL
jgi:hypothetical protein